MFHIAIKWAKTREWFAVHWSESLKTGIPLLFIETKRFPPVGNILFLLMLFVNYKILNHNYEMQEGFFCKNNRAILTCWDLCSFLRTICQCLSASVFIVIIMPNEPPLLHFSKFMNNKNIFCIPLFTACTKNVLNCGLKIKVQELYVLLHPSYSLHIASLNSQIFQKFLTWLGGLTAEHTVFPSNHLSLKLQQHNDL